MRSSGQAVQAAWQVHGLDYYGPCWPIGQGWFLLSRALLGEWGDATLVCPQGQCRLDIRLPDPGSAWVVGQADPGFGYPEGMMLSGPVGVTATFLPAWDPAQGPRFALPEVADAQPWVELSNTGAMVSLWSGHGGRWEAQDPADLLQRCQSKSRPGLLLPFYQPTGVPGLVEAIIRQMGEDPRAVRRGRRCWMVRRGSASLHLCYSEERALLSAEVHLVRVGPQTRRAELMAFLLQENLRLSGYGFSLQEDRVLIALVLPARFLQKEGTAALLAGLLDRSDVYDNELVSRFGTEWLIP